MGAGGRIISIGSCLAERVPGAGVTLYAMSKAALIRADQGARARSRTARHHGRCGPSRPDGHRHESAGGPHADAERSLIALGAYARPEDVAAVVAHLAGAGGRFVTGTAIAVDGGFAA
jgi:3-oxoacyl-[acyl-carrier protein] reductase